MLFRHCCWCGRGLRMFFMPYGLLQSREEKPTRTEASFRLDDLAHLMQIVVPVIPQMLLASTIPCYEENDYLGQTGRIAYTSCNPFGLAASRSWFCEQQDRCHTCNFIAQLYRATNSQVWHWVSRNSLTVAQLLLRIEQCSILCSFVASMLWTLIGQSFLCDKVAVCDTQCHTCDFVAR